RKHHRDGGALSRLARNGDRAFVGPNYPRYGGKPQPPARELSAEEWVEHPRLDFLGHPDAVIDDLQDNLAPGVARPRRGRNGDDAGPAIDRFGGVRCQIYDELLNLRPVGLDRWKMGVESQLDIDDLQDRIAKQPHDLLDLRRKIDPFEPDAALAGV